MGIDALTSVVVGVILLFVVPVFGPLLGVMAVFLTALVLLFLRGTFGTSVGHLVLRLRSIDQLTGLPSFRLGPAKRTVTRGGVDDPFALRSRPVSLPLPLAVAPALPVSTLVILVDDGSAHTVVGAALVGRDPVGSAHPGYALVSIPDLSRTVSRTHLAIVVGEPGLSVTDLGSGNGTWIQHDDEEQLPPRTPTLVPWDSTLLLGDRSIRLTRGAAWGESEASR